MSVASGFFLFISVLRNFCLDLQLAFSWAGVCVLLSLGLVTYQLGALSLYLLVLY